MSLPFWKRIEPEHRCDRRIQIHVPANGLKAFTGRKQTRVPDHQRDVDLLLEYCQSMSPLQVRVGKCFAVIACDNHERILRQTALAQGPEKASELPVSFMDHV